MKTIQKMHYKDNSPEETIDKIKSILSELEIETEETSLDESSIGTYSLRVNIKGTTNGTNGKGVSMPYARASAYAEFMERLQNGLLTQTNRFGEKQSENSDKKYRAYDEKILSTRELFEQGDPYLEQYFKLRGKENLSLEEKIDEFQKVNRMDYMFRSVNGSYLSIPFYSVRDKKIYYIPSFTYERSYGSNGMAAGNTAEEAIVQSISEIYERYVQKKLFLEQPSLPDVPDEYIKKFPYVYEIFQKLREIEGYQVRMLDCSLGGKYPVAGLFMTNLDTGSYGLKLGCHPDYGVAMERTLTEATQGCDVDIYSTRSRLDFNNVLVDNWINISNSFKIGMAQYPYQLFDGDVTYEFVPVKDVSDLSNSEIMMEMFDDILADGYDILLRDVSYLDFGSYHVLVPGMSDVEPADDKLIRAYNTKLLGSFLLTNPQQITKENCNYIRATTAYFTNSLMQNDVRSFYPEMKGVEIPHEEIQCSSLYLSAMCSILFGDYAFASQEMRKIINHARSVAGYPQEKMKKLLAESHYVNGMDVLKDHGEVMDYLSEFFDKEICDEIDDKFKDPSKAIVKQYPSREELMRHTGPTTIKENIQKKLLEAQTSKGIDQGETGRRINII